MKAWYFLLLFVCSPAFAGGVTGGGGNTHPTNPVTANEVRDTLRDARKYVIFYMNYLSRDPKSLGEVGTKLFKGPVAITEMLRRVDVTPVENGACHYADNTPVDGSAMAGAHPSVCISVSRLTDELSKDTLRSQLLALLAHEYSHLVGLDETEATALQVRMLNDLLNTNFSSIEEQFRSMREFSGGRVSVYTEILAHPHQSKWSDLYDQFEWDAVRWKEIADMNILANFQVMDELGLNLLFMSRFRLGFIHSGTCVLAGITGKPPGENSADCKQGLDLIFQPGPEINGNYIAHVMGGGSGHPDEVLDPQIANKLFRRVVNRATLVVEVSRAKQEFAAYKRELDLDAKPLIE